MTNTSDSTMWSSLLHAGLGGTFLKVPHVAPNKEAIKDAEAKAAFYGIPFDSMSVSRTGANYGPRAIREISCQFLSYNATWDFDLVDALSPVDCGDCQVVPGNPKVTFDMAQADISQIVASGAVPVTFGGDHSISIPALRAVKDGHDSPGLVLIDTHLDTALDVGGEVLSNCCPITRAIEHGFDPSKTVLVGISGWMNPRTEIEHCREMGVKVIWLEDLWRDGVDKVIDQVLEIAGTDGLYLTVDVDALDAAYAPGTSTPTPGGLTSREMLLLVRGIAKAGLVGMDVVEASPQADPTTTTVGIAARVVMDGLAAHASGVNL